MEEKTKAMIARRLACALQMVACTGARDDQVEKRQYLAGTDGIGECLVSKYDWSVDDATRAEVDAWIARRRAREADSARAAETAAQITRDYEVLHRQGRDLFVRIDQRYAKDTSRLRQFANNLCEPRRPCTVRFWNQQPSRGSLYR